MSNKENRFHREGKETTIWLGCQRIFAAKEWEFTGNGIEIYELPCPSLYLIAFTHCGQRVGCLNWPDPEPFLPGLFYVESQCSGCCMWVK